MPPKKNGNGFYGEFGEDPDKKTRVDEKLVQKDGRIALARAIGGVFMMVMLLIFIWGVVGLSSHNH